MYPVDVRLHQLVALIRPPRSPAPDSRPTQKTQHTPNHQGCNLSNESRSQLSIFPIEEILVLIDFDYNGFTLLCSSSAFFLLPTTWAGGGPDVFDCIVDFNDIGLILFLDIVSSIPHEYTSISSRRRRRGTYQRIPPT
jgi:hypothetical protein